MGARAEILDVLVSISSYLNRVYDLRFTIYDT